jgi:hypothetical protein|tara:strand:- start:662 stop:889 length:228 start_codon:yes stop_codon:yes gene_type:complete
MNKEIKETTNHGMIEYTEGDLEMHHNELVDYYHKDDVVNPNDAKINDYHERHQDKGLELYCDTHPDSLECRVYDE